MNTLDSMEMWSPKAGGTLGQARKRLEDARLVTGAGSYVADLVTDETLHAHFVRSPIAHGNLIRIDVDAARSHGGVVAVFTAESLQLPNLGEPLGIDRSDVTRPLLATNRVRYVGEPLAVVVADSAARAADAAEMVWPDIEELPLALAAEPGRAEKEPRLFEGSNVLHRSITRPDRTVSEQLPIKASIEVHNQRLAALAIEGLGFLSEPRPSGGLLVSCGHQAPHRLRNQLAATLNLEPGMVRVVVPDVGGAFGLKGMYFTEYGVVAAVALELGVPVVWLETRREHLVAGMHGRDQTHRVTLEGEASGRIRRARIEIVADVGAYPQGGAICRVHSSRDWVRHSWKKWCTRRTELLSPPP